MAPPIRRSGPLRIISDGSGLNSTVVDGQGVAIENITSVTIWMEHHDLNRVDITVLGASVDVKAEIQDVEIICPICNQGQTHTCQPESMGGK